ncbi:glycoside hydrolase family 36 protein [Zasmidium cellare ATCC 36951]|uniref:Alpha-galactosidase n=1 Tax=Zasmidium cellare ATCC 36951 TaxID=1080233 RepID=A0A6A6C271_ZASCE|nr:glycoside hydrolase family 36 protein [Zasmidium cellare ATCC 36951]KAF2159942.1 glycoside hydrolase family 36 protein [Zasmidium cellare ATCC 36951]
MKAGLGVSALAALAGLALGQNAITENSGNFTLTADGMSYLFHVDQASGDLFSDHFGGPSTDFTPPAQIYQGGWSDGLTNVRREFPDVGRSDFRLPAIHIQHADGNTVSAFAYQSHEILQGKPSLPGLPATYGEDADVSTVQVTLYDNYSDVTAVLSYSVFPKYNAVARSFQLHNNGSDEIVIERAYSFSADLPNLDLEMIELQGDWAAEMNRVKRKVQYGETGFRSTEGYSSHIHNPFFALVSPTTTETTGEAWGFNLVYTGSFAATAERFSHGFIRVLLGLNPLHSSLHLAPGDTFTSPEAVAVYSSEGLGGMSRSFHNLYKNHLSRGVQTKQTRPILLNSWEGLGFDYNESSLVTLAGEAEALGIELFVNDDGWFGTEYPRDNDTMGLGDWTPNPAKFPDGLGPYVNDVNNYTVLNSTSKLQFGLWMEPEMVNPNSTLYHEHPDWVLHSGQHVRTLTRNQLVLNLALPEVQEFVLSTVHRILDSANIQYIKWDNNRGIHEMPSPATDHAYILGLYRIIDNLTTTYPDVLWEGCASGGGRFDAGLLHYWPQSWASDDTDASNRLTIQLGTSLAYPPSAMGCHVSAVPNGITNRNISITYRAHVAEMCGSFGFELNPSELSAEESAAIPSIMAEAHKVNPIVITGDFYRLALPDETNWPAAQFISNDTNTAAVFAFQQKATVKPAAPPLRLQGLDPQARYWNSVDNVTYSGATYANAGINLPWATADYQSMLVWLYKQ